MRPVIKVDAVLDLPDVNEELWSALERLAPFGMDNARPIFALRSARLAGPPQLWKEKHLKIPLKQGGRTVVLKGFGMGERAGELQGAGDIDMTFEIERDWFGGLGLLARNFRVFGMASAAV
jgi:single-stranded-DNA-specific exonuclease